ncbi:long-chain-fatty-acid--CoA ligase [Amycolatopsis sp. H20-H5]|uniref:long-chain-fatty-acid--CoA ligase n=1 Tax=Amycolatopsis sp. H20-H5 TaxID=3046309 RepID=UPI002DB761DA|nr:long-chain-fatty-acid--CoA ligase [Amycolatopsis sp. H20-H5]MEC3982369.1 long-chain-fatty-acid--CoA ligase [Amycolatopsis sp. H20-H5]
MHEDVRLLGELIGRLAATRPDAEALSFQGRSRTWAEFDDRVRRVGGGLAAAGIAQGDRVAFVDKNHPACLELTFGASALGAANAVVNWRLSGEELTYVLNDCGARVVFVGAELLPALNAILPVLSSVERVIVVGGDADEYEDFLAAAAPAGIAESVSEHDGALIIYTSGTTGFPKGAVLTHRNLLAHARAVATAFPMTATDRNLVAMPLFHVGGSCYAIVGFVLGQPTTMTREPDAASLLGALAEGVTHAFLVPAVVAGIAQAGERAMAAFAALSYLGYGASPMPLPLLRTVLAAWPEVNFVQVYGMTELSGAVSSLDPAAHRDGTRPERLASAGTVLPGVELRVVDPVSGEDAGQGEAGELWFRTDQRMAGYLGKPEATAETVVEGGWLRSGDVGRVDDGGFVFLEDRVKDMIITGGENVYSPEVERVIAEFPSVGEVAVIGVPDERWGEQVKAIVAPAPGESVDIAKLVEYCRERLAHYKCPRSVDLVEALPRNATGKILKRSLRQDYWRDQERKV